ncbi:MAG TPA: nicotinamide riboside transporter PnuC [Ferruginibacter sp.]|jgi:nicotinamide mononucleotide transporter|nr:nicotinamide riboside transporter PnuC [Ferruginibacter sp.]
MILQYWWSLLVQQIQETSWIVWVSVVFSVAEVLFAKANKIWLYPTGIIGTLLGMYVLFVVGLYAECLLSGYYIVMSVYGWWYWIKKKNLPPVEITYCTREEWGQIVVFTLGGFILLAILLKRYTPSTVPIMDAWVSATAWVGMWLLAKRKIENWILLNISNIFAIPLLFYKHLALYSVLTIFLFIVAIYGYIEWRKIIKDKPLDSNSLEPFIG